MNKQRFVASASVLMSGVLVTAGCGAGGPSASGGDFTDDKVVLALLNDASGVYKDVSGPNSKIAIQMAIDDYQEKYGDEAVVDDIEDRKSVV